MHVSFKKLPFCKFDLTLLRGYSMRKALKIEKRKNSLQNKVFSTREQSIFT